MSLTGGKIVTLTRRKTSQTAPETERTIEIFQNMVVSINSIQILMYIIHGLFVS
jgi:hypothetical protein